MNHVYRLKRSGRTQQLQPVPETARVAGKGIRTGKTLAQAVTGTLASFALGGIASLAYAQQAPPASAPTATQLPQGGVVTRGSANIVTNTGQAQLTVNQSSNRAVIDWASFNVGSQAKVQFNQPGSSAVTLNNILGNNASQIYGQISANGQVFLSNPNGVYFSPTAQVNVGGLVATTGKANADEFMAGKASFNRDGSTGSVVNEGQLTSAAGGYIALLAPEVRNQGVVAAQAGTVALVSGEAITLNFNHTGTGLAGITTTPQAIAALVENRSAVLAEGGQIILSAHALASLQGAVVKNSGQLSATSLSTQGGKIVLMGDSIALTGTSQIQASGATGGGTVLVGGDWQGSGDTRQAMQVTMAAGASIEANATGQGDGGKVVLWSTVDNPDSVTAVHGVIKAEGGPQGGNGGRIETSGHHLDIGGARVSTEAPQGHTGEWLLDPYNITINDAGPTSNVTSTSTSYTANNDSSVIQISSLVSALATNNVTIATGAGGSQNGDITIANPLSWTGLKTLTLNAAGSIVLDANVSWTNTVNTMTWSAGTGGLSGSGNITMPGSGNGTGFSITQGGNSTYAGVISGAGDFTKSGNGTLILTGTNTYTGDGNTATAATNVGLGGTLQVGNGGTSGALGSGWIKNLGTLTFNRSDTSTISQAMQYTVVSPAVTSTGLMKIVAGTWQMNASDRLSPKSVVEISSGAVLDLKSYTNSVGGLTGSGTVTSTVPTGVLHFANAVDTRSEFSGQISGSMRVVMGGLGTQALSGVNTYSGTNPPFSPPTVINLGTLEVSNGSALGAGNIQLNAFSGSVGTLAINGVSLSNNVETLNAPGTNVIKSISTTNVSTLSGSILASGRPITFSTAVDSKLVLSGALNAGTMQEKFTPASGGEVQITGPITSSAGSMLTLDGPGKLTLAGNNSAGNFALQYAASNTGTIRLASNTALGNTSGITVPEGATLEIGSLTNGTNLNIVNKTITLASSNTGAGGGQIVNAAGSNTWSGAVTLNNNSEITVASGTSLNLSSPSSTVSADSRVYFNLDGNLTFNTLTGTVNRNAYAATGSGVLSGTLTNVVPSVDVYARLYDSTGLYSSTYGDSPSATLGFYTTTNGLTPVSFGAAAYSGTPVLTGMPDSSSNANSYSVSYSSGVTPNVGYNLLGAGAATSWTVHPKPLTVSATKEYDGGLSLSSVTLGGLVGSQTLTVSGATANKSHVSANGTNFITALTLGNGINGGVTSNYALPTTLDATTAPVSITAKTLPPTLTNTGITKEYDGNDTAPSFTPVATFTGQIPADSGMSVTLSKTGAVFDTKNVGASSVNVTGLSIIAINSAAGSEASDYQLSSSTATLSTGVSITPRTVSLSGSKTYDGSTTLSSAQIMVNTGVSGEALTVSATTASDAHVATAGKYITSAVLANGTGGLASNYQLPATLDATTAPVTITAIDISANYGGGAITKVYDGSTLAPAGLVGSLTASGMLSGDSAAFSASSSTFNTKNVATANSVTFTGLSLSTVSGTNGSQAGDYHLATSSVSASGAITPKHMTVSGITAANKDYDGTIAATVSVANVVKSGLITGDVVTVTANGVFSDQNPGAGKAVLLTSSYGGADRSNYSITGQASTTADIAAPPSSSGGTGTGSNTSSGSTTSVTSPAQSAAESFHAVVLEPTISVRNVIAFSEGGVSLIQASKSPESMSTFEVAKGSGAGSVIAGSAGLPNTNSNVVLDLQKMSINGGGGRFNILILAATSTEPVAGELSSTGSSNLEVASDNFTVTLFDGTPLPDWIEFDPIGRKLNFKNPSVEKFPIRLLVANHKRKYIVEIYKKD